MFTINDLLNIDKVQELNNELSKIKLRKLKFKQAIRPLFVKFSETIKKQHRKLRKPSHSYNEYIKSKWWTKRKNRYFQRYGKKCLICGSTKTVQLHHKLYGNYGNEDNKHLVALCDFHHKELHAGIGKVKRDMVKETNVLLKEMIDFQKTYEKESGDKYLTTCI